MFVSYNVSFIQDLIDKNNKNNNKIDIPEEEEKNDCKDIFTNENSQQPMTPSDFIQNTNPNQQSTGNKINYTNSSYSQLVKNQLNTNDHINTGNKSNLLASQKFINF